VAISTGIHDSGTFELNFKDERFLPFEGAGVISTWKLELPTVVKQFDYHTISDVVLHMRYTAMRGGSGLQKAANEAVGTFRENINKSNQGGFWAFFDLRNDLPNEWYAFQSKLKDRETVALSLGSLLGRLPFWARASCPRYKPYVSWCLERNFTLS